MIIEFPRGFDHGPAFQILFKGELHDRLLFFINKQVSFFIRVKIIAKQVPAVPEAALRPGDCGVTISFGCLRALEFSQRHHYGYKEFSLRGRGVIVLLEADELDIIFGQYLEEIQEVFDRAAYAVKRGTDDRVDLA